jgi:hypothetical protein
MSIHRSDNEEQIIQISFTHVAAFETASFVATFAGDIVVVDDGPRTHYWSWYSSAAAAGRENFAATAVDSTAEAADAADVGEAADVVDKSDHYYHCYSDPLYLHVAAAIVAAAASFVVFDVAEAVVAVVWTWPWDLSYCWPDQPIAAQP